MFLEKSQDIIISMETETDPSPRAGYRVYTSRPNSLG